MLFRSDGVHVVLRGPQGPPLVGGVVALERGVQVQQGEPEPLGRSDELIPHGAVMDGRERVAQRDELRALKAKERRRAAKRKKIRERPEDEAA